MAKRQKMVMSTLYCRECDNKMSIPRKQGSLREDNHIKDLWCTKCQTRTKHIEKTVDKNVSFWDKWQAEQLGEDIDEK